MEYKRAKVIMLPTKYIKKPYRENGFASIGDNDKLFTKTQLKENWQFKYNPQHLYVISDDEIKVGDWFLTDDRNSKSENNGNPIWKLLKCDSITNKWIESNSEKGIGYNPDWSKKIIATTDDLWVKEPILNQLGHFNNYPLPQPSQQFIQKYIEEYNKGNVITDVLVEYETTQYNSSGVPVTWSSENNLEINTVLKVDKNNTITIVKL